MFLILKSRQHYRKCFCFELTSNYRYSVYANYMVHWNNYTHIVSFSTPRILQQFTYSITLKFFPFYISHHMDQYLVYRLQSWALKQTFQILGMEDILHQSLGSFTSLETHLDPSTTAKSCCILWETIPGKPLSLCSWIGHLLPYSWKFLHHMICICALDHILILLSQIYRSV